jgi:hypothetical protein
MHCSGRDLFAVGKLLLAFFVRFGLESLVVAKTWWGDFAADDAKVLQLRPTFGEGEVVCGVGGKGCASRTHLEIVASKLF